MTPNIGKPAREKRRIVTVQDPEEIYQAMDPSFQDSGEIGDAFLDLETGDVVYSRVQEGRGDDDIKDALERGVINEEDVTLASEIYEDPAKRERYLHIPHGEAWWGYQDLKDFIETIQDFKLSHRLARAIQGKGAFGRFKEELSAAGGTWLDQWHVFEADRHESRVREWLEDHNIELRVRRERQNC